MKADVKIKFNDIVSLLLVGNERNPVMTYDEDYVEDFDDVIDWVEEDLFEKYGVAFHYKTDFEIENATEICENLS